MAKMLLKLMRLEYSTLMGDLQRDKSVAAFGELIWLANTKG